MNSYWPCPVEGGFGGSGGGGGVGGGGGGGGGAFGGHGPFQPSGRFLGGFLCPFDPSRSCCFLAWPDSCFPLVLFLAPFVCSFACVMV